MDQSLTCNNPACHHSREIAGENFASLSLPLHTAEGQSFSTVQEAVDDYMPDEEVELDEACRCGANVGYTKKHTFVAFPRVLVVYLNRWAGHQASDAVLHSIVANRTLLFRGTFYRLCATVCHLGDRPDSGHYVTVARHPTDLGEWWLYDDSRCSMATPEQISTMCTYAFWGQCSAMSSFTSGRTGGSVAETAGKRSPDCCVKVSRRRLCVVEASLRMRRAALRT